jgi:hypothetical protein
MNAYRIRRCLPIALAAILAVIAAGAGSAGAASAHYGQLARFGKRAKQGDEADPTPDEYLAGQGAGAEAEESHYAIGVDPKEGDDVFVLDEPIKLKEEKLGGGERFQIKRHIRIQKFDSSTGTFLATTSTFTVTSPEVEEEEDTEAESISNIAVDPERKVFYVLVGEPRKVELLPDREARVATALYAFKTEQIGNKLVPAEHADKDGVEGLLAGPSELQAESKEAGAALIEPAGITVDPKTGEIIILAHIDERGAEKDEIGKDHFVLQRVGDEGKLGEHYIDETGFFEKEKYFGEAFPNSPVVTVSEPEPGHKQEHVLVLFEGITEIPSDFEKATEEKEPPKRLFRETVPPEDIRSIAGSGNELEAGGSLSASPEGTLYEAALINNEELDKSNNSPYVAGVSERSSVTGAMIGWSGGQTPIAQTDDDCVLEPWIDDESVYVAAGEHEDVFVLAPEYLKPGEGEGGFKPATHDAIVELGPNGSGCPPAAGSAIELEQDGRELSEAEPVATEQRLQFSTKVEQADALSAELTIENKATKEKTTVTEPLEFGLTEKVYTSRQKPVLSFTFEEPGVYVVTEKVRTDNLATPEVTATAPRTVTVDAVPKIVKQPASREVKEGESATFTAEASGTPEPKEVEWEVSVGGGGFEELHEGDGVKVHGEQAGANWMSSLTLEKTTVSESGNMYRAVFKNKIGNYKYKAATEPATLTVKSASGGKAPVVEHQPVSKEITEGETAAFSATASGSPKPSVRWEEKVGAGEFTPIVGATSETLTIEKATVSQSGREFRAKFTNEFESKDHEVDSDAATLTVKAKAPPPGPSNVATTTTGVSPPPPQIEVKGETVVHDPEAKIADTSLTVAPSGALALEVTCPAKEQSCSGTVTLRTVDAVSASAHKHKAAPLMLASGSFTVAGGKVEAITLHLSGKARTLLEHAHVLRAHATIIAHDPAGVTRTTVTTVTLRPARPKAKRSLAGLRAYPFEDPTWSGM